MPPKKILITLLVLILLAAGGALLWTGRDIPEERFISYTVNPRTQELKLYWKNDSGAILKTFDNLKLYTRSKGRELIFAMNGGMFTPDFAPLGLYVENGITLNPPDTGSGNGNFYLKPNGVFYITRDRTPGVATTDAFLKLGNIALATQSGPMLLIDGQIHPAFRKGSNNLHIRNGVGILPGNKAVFAISKEKVSLHDFADYFRRLGCRNALYLDGYVSRVYLPEQGLTGSDGEFGVMIGLTKER